MTTETLLLLILIVFVLGSLPTWPHSKSWGYAPMGILSIVLVVFLVWAIVGERPLFRSSGGNIESSVERAGQNIKEAGRDVVDTVRDATN